MARYLITFDREEDGRWIAGIDDLRVWVYGASREDAYHRAKTAVLFRLAADADDDGAPIDDAIAFEAAP